MHHGAEPHRIFFDYDELFIKRRTSFTWRCLRRAIEKNIPRALFENLERTVLNAEYVEICALKSDPVVERYSID